MKLLLIGLISFISFSSWARCDLSLQKDYSTLYNWKMDEPMLLVKQELAKGVILHLVAAKASCGATGCEYAGYLEKKGCPERVISFTGSSELGTVGPFGLKSIKVMTVHEKGAKKTCDWVFDPSIGKMQVQIYSCKLQKH
jgi:hypothetical protein